MDESYSNHCFSCEHSWESNRFAVNCKKCHSENILSEAIIKLGLIL